MRDHDYIRRVKVKKSASSRNVSGSTSASSHSLSMRSDESEETATAGQSVTRLPPISVNQVDSSLTNGKGRAGSPTGSSRTATPTSGYPSPLTTMPGAVPTVQHPASSSTSLNILPSDPIPKSSLPHSAAGDVSKGRAQRQRKSMLQGLTPAQMRRISAALVEIGHGHGLQERLGGSSGRKEETLEDEEETLEPNPESPAASRLSAERQRHESTAKSDSGHSTSSSSVFPYYVSPTTSSFAAAIQPPSEPSSPPARIIPASPKSRDLRAQVDRPPTPNSPTLSSKISPTLPVQSLIIAEGSRPTPVLTPTKSQPVRHNTSLSTDSSPVASSIPRYIPGQPRPIGSGSVRSDGSDSSRSATPTNPYSRAGGSALAPSPNGHRNRSDSNPSPNRQPPGIASRTTSLARSQSVQQHNSQNGTLSPPLSAPSRSSSGSGDSTLFGPKRGLSPSLSGSRRPSSPLVTDVEKRNVIPEADEDYVDAEVDAEEEPHVRVHDVPSRRSVAHSRSDSASPAPHLPYTEPAPPDISRAPSQQGYISSYPEGSHDSHDDSNAEPTGPQALRHAVSHESIGSSFNGSIGHSGEGGIGWSSTIEGVKSDKEQIGYLRDLCGMEREEFREMQIRLVDRAKAEREALLGGMAERSFSPVRRVAGG